MGCQPSKLGEPVSQSQNRSTIKGVGQTERLVSRAVRAQENQSRKVAKEAAASGKLGSGGDDGSLRKNGSTTSLSTNLDPPKLDASGHLMPEEVARRTQCSVLSESLLLGTEQSPIAMQFAYWTQRGYYPDDPHKENQDELVVETKFAGNERDCMFSVLDGHGNLGHACARFAKKQLPKCIAKYVRQNRVKQYQDYIKANNIKGAKGFDPKAWPLLDAATYQDCCRKAYLECNSTMHNDEKVDDKLSGTTAISVNFHGTLMTVSNVGDSRAILGHWIPDESGENPSITADGIGEEEKTEIESPLNEEQPRVNGTSTRFPSHGKIIAIPLSRDQTPYRMDERERVKKAGAAIMSIDQLEGQEEMHENWGDTVLGEDVDVHGDPPRVWIQGKDYPGTAFTRSLGDRLAKDIGVSAEPEILARNLTTNDHVLVIASDGIFEFLTNQEVIDICIESESPIIACESLVKAAYAKWLLYENRTDDITVIVCFLDVSNPPPPVGVEGSTEDLIELAKSAYGQKPMRSRFRKSGIDAESPSRGSMHLGSADVGQ